MLLRRVSSEIISAAFSALGLTVPAQLQEQAFIPYPASAWEPQEVSRRPAVPASAAGETDHLLAGPGW